MSNDYTHPSISFGDSPAIDFKSFGRILNGNDIKNIEKKIKEDHEILLKSLTKPLSKPSFCSHTNSSHKLRKIDMVKNIDLVCDTLREWYEEMALIEQNNISPLHFNVFSNQISEILVQKLGLFTWNISITFISANQHEQMQAIKGQFSLSFEITIYTIIEDDSYLVEVYRRPGVDKINLFYDIFNHIKNQLQKAEIVEKVWRSRRAFISLYESVQESNKVSDQESVKVSLKSKNIYLFIDVIVREVCSFLID
jgi:hypothetical protein